MALSGSILLEDTVLSLIGQT